MWLVLRTVRFVQTALQRSVVNVKMEEILVLKNMDGAVQVDGTVFSKLLHSLNLFFFK